MVHYSIQDNHAHFFVEAQGKVCLAHGMEPSAGERADRGRECEVAPARTWLLSKGWRRIGLIDPVEAPGALRRDRR